MNIRRRFMGLRCRALYGAAAATWCVMAPAASVPAPLSGVTKVHAIPARQQSRRDFQLTLPDQVGAVRSETTGHTSVTDRQDLVGKMKQDEEKKR